jgi:hypothetical protein
MNMVPVIGMPIWLFCINTMDERKEIATELFYKKVVNAPF